MSLVKVWTEVGNDGRCFSLPAKIVSTKKGNTFIIKYLSVTNRKTREGKKIYAYEDETYEVTDDSITEYLESESELDLGFEQVSGTTEEECEFVKYESDSDDDYIPSSDDDDESSSESDTDDSDDEEEEEDSMVDYSSGEYDDE
jgi:hypothetical protein